MTDYRRFSNITNADVYLEDNSLLGITREFKIPSIEWKTVDIETLGQVAVFKTPTRVLEALTGTMKFQALEPELAEEFYNPTKVHKLQLHQHLDVNGPDGLDRERSCTLITIASVQFFKTEFGGAKLGDLDEVDYEFTCSRLVQRVHDSDSVLLEVDVFNNKARNSSGDIWAR
ncbi:phage major tail tube protein [Labrenzia sp. R4_2]|uniref:phage major tail tube protein n=1 Tax=Labrenzia sp. R4_2 TaxID=2821107 RepID=UPI001AD970C8|nr:phage major tail tube protein [Labrenzia sp. R4_2]MBO9421708.1 phage major tail tube protein [Labrenzia sp. R4_2]